MVLLQLLLGIKRLRFRANDPKRAAADNEYRAKRKAKLANDACKCVYCTYTSKKFNEVHHLDDDHHNNDDSNLVVACRACHPYQHVGEPSKAGDISGEGLGKKTIVVAIPEITPQDLNHLQRAIGMALMDEKEEPAARAILRHIEEMAGPVKAVWETCLPVNFAAAMAQLTPGEYKAREPAIGHLRLVFAETVLKEFGSQWAIDSPSLPVNSWKEVAANVARKLPDTVEF